MRKRQNTLFSKDDTNGVFRTGKITKKLIISLLVALTVLVALAFLIPSLNRVTWRSEIIIRQAKLNAWHDRIKYFKDKNGQLPKNLYEASIFEDLGFYYIKVSEPQNFEYTQALLNDPNLFF